MSIRINNIDGLNGYVDVNVTDRSYRLRQIAGDDKLYLYFSHAGYLNIAVGAYVDFESSRYYLVTPGNFKKHHSRNYGYTLVLEGKINSLSKYKMRDSAEKLLKFPLTAKPQQHLQLLIDNINERDSGWSIGTCIDSTAKLVNYNHTNLREALQMIAEAFETEWEIQGKVISLKKVEYNKTNPLSLSYGKGNGFKTGLGRTNTDDKGVVEVLHIQGGERNIDYSKYGTRTLLLPKSKTYTYLNREYITSSDGRSIQRNDKPLTTGREDSLDCSHIYPSREGAVSEVITVDAGRNLYNFKDTSIPDSLDYSQCLIDGETMTVVFNDGMLAGREFEIDSYVHADRLFRIVPKQEDGLALPNDTFKPVVGTKYAVFGVQLPDAYIEDDATQSGASWDMLKEAVEYMYDNEEPRFTFTGKLDGIWAKQDWLNIGGKIVLGGYVNFTDTQFQPSGALIRIVGIKDFINNPHAPELELSNVTIGGSIISEIGKIKQNEVLSDEQHREAIGFTKRRFRSAQETVTMLSEVVDGYSKGINPLSVQSMSMIVGDESLQFRFVTDKINPVEITHNITIDNNTKVLSADGGWIQHMSIGITELSAGSRTYKFWSVAQYSSAVLSDTATPYYLYIKASTTAETAEFYLSETAISMTGVTGYYYFLVGFLNSEVDGERSFAPMYGFTEILPGRITTQAIHADTINVTALLAQQIYSSGATIGSVDISPNDLATGIDGLRLGNLVSFNPTAGQSGILIGTDGNATDKYRMYIGNETEYILFNGSNLIISGHAMLGDGSQTVNDITATSSKFVVVNPGQANEYLKCTIPLAVEGEVQAWTDGGSFPPTIWESMPAASTTSLGGIKVGAGLSIDQYGVLTATGTTTPAQLLSFSNPTLTISGGNSVDLSSLSVDAYTKAESDAKYSLLTHDHSGVYEPIISKSVGYMKWTGTSWVFVDETYSLSGHNHDTTYLGINANAASASKLNTARTIGLSGDATGSASFDGTANVTINTTIANDSHTHDSRYYTETESDARFLGINNKASDSDKLDGLDSTQFLRSDVDDSANGLITFNNTSDNASSAIFMSGIRLGKYVYSGSTNPAWNKLGRVTLTAQYQIFVGTFQFISRYGAHGSVTFRLERSNTSIYYRAIMINGWPNKLSFHISYIDDNNVDLWVKNEQPYSAVRIGKLQSVATSTSGNFIWDNSATVTSTAPANILKSQYGYVGQNLDNYFTIYRSGGNNITILEYDANTSGYFKGKKGGVDKWIVGNITGTNDILYLNNITNNDLRLATSNSTRLTINGSGNVGIGTTTPTKKLDVDGDVLVRNTSGGAVYSYGGYSVGSGDSRGIRFWNSDAYKIYMSTDSNSVWGGSLVNDTDYHMYFVMTGGSNRGFVWKNNNGVIGQLSSAGNLYTKGEITAYSSSDKRFKDDVKTIKNGVETVKKLRPVTYVWNNLAKSLNVVKEGADVGFIAQEVEEVLPEVVHGIYGKYKSLDYAKFTPHLVAAVQEQQREIEQLKQQLKQLRDAGK